MQKFVAMKLLILKSQYVVKHQKLMLFKYSEKYLKLLNLHLASNRYKLT